MDFLKNYDALPDEQKAGFLLGTIKQDPDAVFADLRQNRPILVTPGPRPIGLITRFADVTEALAHWTVFTVRLYAAGMDPSVGPFMLGRDDMPLNEREKSIMLAMLPREDMPKIRALATGLAGAALAPSLAQKHCEVVGTLGRPVPIGIVERYFGFQGPDVETMKRWSRATQADMFHNLTNDPAVHLACVEAGAEMRRYLSDFLAKRRFASDLDSSTDAVSRLLRTNLPDEIGWDEERLLSNIMGLLVGAVETSNAAIVQVLDQLLSRPEVLAQATLAAESDDDATLDALIWEVLRFNPINPFVARIAASNYVVAAGSDHATQIPAGTLTLISTRSAMQDPDAFPDPLAIRLDRPAYSYMHFGSGPHTCLGKYAGLMLVPAVIKQILLLLPNLRRAEGPEGTLQFDNGPFPESLTVAFGPKGS